jgi:hypothetical protein
MEQSGRLGSALTVKGALARILWNSETEFASLCLVLAAV